MSLPNAKAYIYCLLCCDGSIYTGVAADLEKRMRVHFKGGAAAAAYTRAHGARRLLIAFAAPSLSAALRGEARIKRLSRKEKEALIADPAAYTDRLFSSIEEGPFTPLLSSDAEIKRINQTVFNL